MAATWPWAVIVLAAGFVGGLAAGRALDRHGVGDEIPDGFRYIPQREPELRVVGGAAWLDEERAAAEIRRMMTDRERRAR